MKKSLLLLSLLLMSLSCYGNFNQGVTAYQKGDYSSALKIWQEIAEQKPSKTLAAEEIREAQYSLALLYWQGQGVTQSYQEAEKWLLLVANQGHSEAQSKLGNLYLLGLTGETDTEKARLWFEKSAQQGNVNGQYNLGVIYLDGVGVEKDINLAKKWLTAAAQQGDKTARDLLAEANLATTAPKAELNTGSTTEPQNTAAPTNDYYAIQLFSSTRQHEAVQFVQNWQTRLTPLVNTDKMKKSQQLFIVVYGSFASMAEAKQTIVDLPQELKQNRPWVIKMRGNKVAP